MKKYTTTIIFLLFFVFAKDSLAANSKQICEQIPLNPKDNGFCQCIETNVGSDKKVSELMLYIKKYKPNKDLFPEWVIKRYFELKRMGKENDDEFTKIMITLGEKKAERFSECMMRSASQMKQ